MRTLILDPSSIAGLDEILERRRRWGVDTHDEVWEGVLHVASPFATSGEHGHVASQLAVLLGPPARAAGLVPTGAFNLGEWEHDYRVPDGGLHRDSSWDMCAATAALVVEIVTPGDESWENTAGTTGCNSNSPSSSDHRHVRRTSSPQSATSIWASLRTTGSPTADYTVRD